MKRNRQRGYIKAALKSLGPEWIPRYHGNQKGGGGRYKMEDEDLFVDLTHTLRQVEENWWPIILYRSIGVKGG